jgi:hypothetical protein
MLIAAIIGASGSVLSVIFAWWNRKKVIEVHMLVNDRLSATLSEIGTLNQEIGNLKAQVR